MRIIAKIVVAFLINGAALWLAAIYIRDFRLDTDPPVLASAALALTVLNLFLRPILKLVLSPIIFITLGLGLLLVNGLILAILDKLSSHLTIETFGALFYGTLILSVANAIYHWATRSTRPA